MKNRRFFRVPRTTHHTSAGLVDLPILYFDVRTVVAFFDAPLAGVEQVLEGTHLVPAVVRGRRAACALAFYEYRDTSVGVYNEMGTAILVLREGEPRPALGPLDLMRSPRARRIGMYVVDLPVTTALANAAGRELWGYPKFVTEIPFELRGRHFDSSVMDPDGQRRILRLRGDAGRGIVGPPLSLSTYTFLDGALIRTPVDVRGPIRIHSSGSLRLEIGASDHPMAQRLRTLGLAETAPSFVTISDRFQSKLHAGTRVEAL
ncbi:MAG: acetoacetate decarboxylase family protein [Myxococcales bacterium]|nr:acetoacetate decarboxylase family protein [Myxococcales bacterium]MCB9579502.1 acetoacetate decarboxylase family protein [Polyangiaceae bacterium]